MVKFTNQQSLEIIKNYYRNSKSVVATLRALTPIFGRYNRSTRQAVRAIVHKFEIDHPISRFRFRHIQLGIYTGGDSSPTAVGLPCRVKRLNTATFIMKANKTKEKGEEKEDALNTPTHAAVLASTSGTTAANKDLGASPEAEGWKDILQLLKEQKKKKKLARALSVIQQGMLKNNPGHVKDSVDEVLSGMLNIHKCLLESGMEFQKRLESYSTSKRIGIFRKPRSAALGDIPKNLTKVRRGLLLLHPRMDLPRKGKSAHHQPIQRPLEARPHRRMGNGSW